MAAVIAKRINISCRGARPRMCCVVPKATSVLPPKQALKATAPLDGALHPRTASYVNFSATAVDFYKVLARLEAASYFARESQSVLGASVPGPNAPQRKPWTGIFDGLFGGSRISKQTQTEVLGTLSGSDDIMPLRHAVVMFTATWCGPCSVVYRELKLAVGRLQGRPPTAIIVIDVEEEKELASELGIKALPTLLYLSPDESRGPIFTLGPVSASFILDAMDRAVDCGGRNIKAKWLKL
ncbi:hypothetical protein VOLCADRAFT_121727 [Volvox carteri f. nagariensis]|uniref:Thioredoxin domain-containing protein n=1 Tax=Volvox carteri f. nagariensis TaxID=3068 RepID=D8UIW2_VOLCA|nr:uncharacterized protein VOLCADRAFT_121727 [Volvox carteri f. nagariensis]EFJ40345.1 hypothetical protein VOLCADRAFT_121727 [Volvox carteri f. nagariensis]|eukprot:XP_002958608.1 hypothetical protein VOLCADRAFT_121727 [Volvox carteri f. nagariensis]